MIRDAALVLAIALAIAACDGARGARPIAPSEPARAPLSFSFEGVDGRPISSAAFADRVTVIGFFTTYDVHSQAEARFLAALAKRHSPVLNVAALMLESAENKPLVVAFAKSMSLPYPVGLADAATIAGDGPFAGLHHVPSVVILDRRGREAFRRVGFIDEASLEAAVRAVEKRADQ